VDPAVLVNVTAIDHGGDMQSENPAGADNQQGSRPGTPKGLRLTPQRLHAELLAVGAMGLEAYLQECTALYAVLSEEPAPCGDGRRSPRKLGDQLRSGSQPECQRRSRLPEGLRAVAVPRAFLKLVGSWHPRKRQQIETRMVR
jgi:hypothetical protein